MFPFFFFFLIDVSQFIQKLITSKIIFAFPKVPFLFNPSLVSLLSL